MPKVGKNYSEHLNVRVPTAEMQILRQYCEDTHRTQSDVIREFIRSLRSVASHQNTDVEQR
ncbi:CopG family transcriptional regulator [Trichocoleus sp. FACHB-262]|uniref:CopG family transcriptional regulator n=1 Tax=Trichocoleus sp. FACHB-262 TaxID=2692869 RepID=UPI001682DE9C|nr:CopG family transcriptional regulator [Trichocoleus sp. FACHB-262]MBD2120181.1 CopG family transcriptional regulator [Trichocoleus sp. FACHB-262]